MQPRVLTAIWAGKAAGAASRILRRGGGTAIAGLVAERAYPHIVRALLAQAGGDAVALTGTNGKTTTSLMVSRIAAQAGLSPLHNRSGSNLMRGVASMLVEEASLGGRFRGGQHRLAILEVDEATLPLLMRESPPRVALFTNLFRDQLDRYGEVDTVAAAWERALAAAPPAMAVVLNADDPAIAHLGRSARGSVVYYGVDDTAASVASDEHASDFRTCLDCGGELAYTATFYGHVGHWRCSSCANARPGPDVRIARIEPHANGTRLTVEARGETLHIALPLAGLYNAYNALAAIACAVALGLPPDTITPALEGFSAAFGRQERFRVDGRDVSVVLGKNPTGLNQALRTLAAEPGEKRLLFFLNDGVADGRDVSWIWDADYELLQRRAAWVIAAGRRAEDLALRLKYAGYGDDLSPLRDTRKALDLALAQTPPGATLHILPTYTAMVEVRELLANRAGASHYWDAT